MVTQKKFILNIKIVLFIRLLFGYCCNFYVSSRAQRLAKLYRAVVLCAHVFTVYYLDHSSPRDITVYTIYLAGYIAGVVMLSEKFFIDYFRYNFTIDGAPTAKKQYSGLKILLILIYTTLCGLRIMNLILFYLSYHSINYLYTATIYVAYTSLLNIAMEFGRLPVIFSFALLFYRTKVLRTCLETYRFENKPHSRFTARRYLQMYRTLLDGLKSIDRPIKLMISAYTACVAPKFVSDMYVWLLIIKEKGPNFFVDLMFVTASIQQFAFVVIPAAMMDIISNDIEQIKIITVEGRLVCKNERDRSDVSELFQYLKNQPLDYVIWRLIPLSLHFILSFIAFCVTTIIAILQIKTITQE